MSRAAMSAGGKAFDGLLNGGEQAALYCFVFFYFIFAGPGPWSVDATRRAYCRSYSPSAMGARFGSSGDASRLAEAEG